MKICSSYKQHRTYKCILVYIGPLNFLGYFVSFYHWSPKHIQIFLQGNISLYNHICHTHSQILKMLKNFMDLCFFDYHMTLCFFGLWLYHKHCQYVPTSQVPSDKQWYELPECWSWWLQLMEFHSNILEENISKEINRNKSMYLYICVCILQICILHLIGYLHTNIGFI